MKFNYKSKLGFTLIELLVVIGILAVLAAIAIPSVAGLIDRANVSADATNANEMTNAVERFVSEYELYVQDISSGRLDTENLDAAQGRVKNVTNVIDRAGIETLEKDATAGTNTTGRAIYRDTKYPVNAETMIAVVENYMKTSSTTFTPKQSNCHYYYSPDCGLVVCTETEKSDVTNLNALVQSGKDAKGKDLSASTKWIDLTESTSVDNTGDTTNPEFNHSGTIPEGAVYEKVNNIINIYTCGLCGQNYEIPSCPDHGDDYLETSIRYQYTRLNAGDSFPESSVGDLYYYKEFTYCYGSEICHSGMEWGITCPYCENHSTFNGWGVLCNSDGLNSPSPIESINNKPIISLANCFWSTSYSYFSDTVIPDTVTNLDYAFWLTCNNDLNGLKIPQSVTSANHIFQDSQYMSGKIYIPCHLTIDSSELSDGSTLIWDVYHYSGCGH